MSKPPKLKEKLTPPLENKIWCSFNNDGQITYIDWPYAELLRERHIQGTQRDMATFTATLIIGVRETVLHNFLPDQNLTK